MWKPGEAKRALAALLLLLLLPKGAAAVCGRRGEQHVPAGGVEAACGLSTSGLSALECLEGGIDEVSLLTVATALKPGRTRTPGAQLAPGIGGSMQMGVLTGGANETPRFSATRLTRTFSVDPTRSWMPSTTFKLPPLPPFSPKMPPRFLPWNGTLEDATEGVWARIINSHRRSKWHGHHRRFGIVHFFTSAEFIDWAFFLLATFFFLEVHVLISSWEAARKFHVTALVFWVLLGGLYDAIMWVRLGPDEGQQFLVGYLLEFIFSIENVFIYHVVARSFHLRNNAAQKALVIVIVCQIIFQLGFFIGLADFLKSLLILPYIVGAWLLYVAYHTMSEEEEDETMPQDEKDKGTEELPMVARYFASVFGERFVPSYKANNVLVVRDGKLCFTMLAPATLSLLMICFVMEVDVTLTKIEEIPNHFVAFTSSMAAAFAVPEIFFVARDLFSYFRFLKYGITFVLVFFGIQLLLHELFSIPDMIGILIIVLVALFCMILSVAIPDPQPKIEREPDESSVTSGRSESSRGTLRRSTTI